MDFKKIRRLATMISGIVVAALSVFFLFYIDTALQAGVEWLLGIAGFGLIGSVLLFGSSIMAEDEENLLRPVINLCSSLLLIGFVVVLILMLVNKDFIQYGKYHIFYFIAFYFVFVITILTTIISIVSLVFDSIEKISFVSRAIKYYAYCRDNNLLVERKIEEETDK